MKMKKSLSVILSVIAILLASCNNWMKDDDFYDKIENDVKVANAANVSVYIRYANSKMGTTDPSGFTTLKKDIPAEISAVTNDDYGFVRWVAFSTNDFPANQQHSNLFYESAEKYAQDFQALELPANEVVFEDPLNPSTKVTLETNRSDIFITPLVAKRPTVVTSVPSNGRTGVVKNSQIRILFSKPIDETTLKDEFGNSNIVITSGSAVLTESSELGAKDITSNFNFTLSKTKKMLTISAKKDAQGSVFLFDSNSQITISIYEDVCDTDGYNMNGKYSFSFTTGTKQDSLAPFIEILSAGIGDDCESFVEYTGHKPDKNEYQAAADSASNNLADYVGYKEIIKVITTNPDNTTTTTNIDKPLLAQRVKDKINIYVKAVDIAGSGGSVSIDQNTTSESDVALIQIRASLYVNSDGSAATTSAEAFAANSPVTDPKKVIEAQDIGYAMGVMAPDCQIRGKTFEEIIPTGAGTIFTYDLSSLDDGLIKIDLWAVDMVGNSGDTERYSGKDYNYGNGYRSIFVVKDSTKPDATTEKTKISIESKDNGNDLAKYGWYNNNAVNHIKLFDTAQSRVNDASNEHLRSDDSDLMWAFKLGNDPSWMPSASDWKLVSEGWDVKNISSNNLSDGPVDITMRIKDDLGNISDAVVYKTINYDNSSSGVSPTVSWVKKIKTDEYEDIVATTSQSSLSDSGHILKIPFTEQWAGIRRIQLTVTKSGSDNPIPQSGYEIHYVPDSGTSRNLSFVANTGDLKILNVDDSSKVTTGTLYINKITIGNDNAGLFNVKVKMWDSSLNPSETSAEISIDKTAPTLRKMYIPDLKESVVPYTSNGTDSFTDSTYNGWFLSKEYIGGPNAQSSETPVKPGYIPLYLFVTEKDSGIHKIAFSSDNVEIYKEPSTTHGKTTLYKIENYGTPSQSKVTIPGGDYTVDPANKTITLNNDKCIKSSNEFVILVDNIGFDDIRTGENKINVNVYDLATLTASKDKISPYDGNDNKEITGIKVDSYLSNSEIAYTLKDRQDPGSKIVTKAGYTDDDTINLEVTFNTDTSSDCAKAAYNSIRLSGAKFIPGSTEVYLNGRTKKLPYELSENNTVLTLRVTDTQDTNNYNKYIVISNNTITIKNIKLDNAAQGGNDVTVTAYDLAGWNTSLDSQTIVYDTVKPTLEAGPFTSNYTNSSISYYKPDVNIYPHTNGESAFGVQVGGIPTFYSSTTLASGVSTENGRVDLSSKSASAVLGFRAKDTQALYGIDSDSSVLYYKHTSNDTNVDKAKIITSGTFATSLTSSDPNNENAYRFDINFEQGKYSAVIVDKAGNTSDVFRFDVVKDDVKPVVTGLNDYVLFESPSGSSIYRNANSIEIGNNEIDINPSGYTGSFSVNTIRYATKKTGNNKYKVILNLGASKYTSVNSVTKINGGAPNDRNSIYGELSATSSSSPIEQYAISTWYGSWPTGSEYKTYTPVVPKGTVFPNGVAHNAVTTEAPNALMARQYFGGNSAFTSFWHVDNTKTNWHDYKNRTGTATNTDSGNGIVSYVENNNLIIELPQHNIAPISVFLRDGCGNMNFVVLGVKTNSSNVEYAPSFILDDHLGYAQTNADGEVIEPILVQNPYMVSGGNKNLWDGVYYVWNNQSGNTDEEESGMNNVLGFMKDEKKKATYYNPYFDSTKTVKLGLTLRFGEVYNTCTNPESVTFGINGKASSADVADGKYTARALLYCTQDTGIPTKETILSCWNAQFGNPSGVKTGQITDWTYVQASGTTSEVTILLDYPEPDYSKITGWSKKNNKNEPEPYYIWYLYEDRIGNYEIAKVVNSKAKGNQLKTNTNEMYDKWFYDNVAPVITIRNTSTSPKDIQSNQTAVESLVADNNGYVPYLKPGTTPGSYTNYVYVSTSANHTVRDTSLKSNKPVGNGTTRYIEGTPTGDTVGVKNSSYLPFFDLEVSEDTGIRAYCWSTSATPPAVSNDYTLYDGQGTINNIEYWNAGYTAYSLTAHIGSNFKYDNEHTRDAANAYFSFSDSSYANAYSGTKINTVIPYDLFTDSYSKTLYLHVMDWTGNVSTYRMGTSLEFLNDTTEPVISTGSYAGQSVPNQYYLIKESGTDPVLRIAGMGTYATGNQDIKVYLPAIDDNSTGAGILGYSFTNLDLSTAKSDNHGAYLEIPATEYSTFGTEKEITYYVYDKVGNISSGKITGIFDATPPELEKVTVNVGSGYKMYASGDTEISTSKYYTDSYRFYENTTEDPLPANVQKVIYVNANNVVSFNVNISEGSVSDLASIKIYQWDNGWQEKATGTENTTTSYSISSTNISYSTSGTIFQILATDQSGNTSCQYFKLYLDNVAPTFASHPTVSITKGSVNKVTVDSNSYYYAYASNAQNAMTITLNVADAGVGTVNNTYKYKIDSGAWTSFTGTTKTISFTTTTSVEKISICDVFGNATTTSPQLQYSVGDTKAEDINKLVNFEGNVPTAPSMSIISVKTKGSSGYSNKNYETNINGKFIRITDRNRTGIQLTFNIPQADKEKVMGYIESDSAPATTKDLYSLNTNSSVKTVFTYEGLPPNGSFEDFYKTYYAVDFAGNINTTPLRIQFTYDNPYAAQNIEFVPYDSSIISTNSSLQSSLSSNSITLTKSVTNSTNVYYKSGTILIRCTLDASGTGTYQYNPAIVTLYEGNSNTSCGEFKIQNSTLKRINLGEQTGERYYCYLAFDIGSAQNGKQLYCTISSVDSQNETNSTSEKVPLFSSSGANMTWSLDSAGPAIDSAYYATESSNGCYPNTNEKIKKLKGYKAYKSDGTEITSFETVSDNQIGKAYGSNAYSSGTKIYIPKNKITDNAGVVQYLIMTVQETTANNGDASYTKTPVGTWYNMVDDGGSNYVFTLPDISAPHTHIGIFLKDGLGNIEPYYLGEISHSYFQWWILDKTLEPTDITTSAASWTANTTEYTLTVTIPVGTIVRSVSAVNATVTNVHFNNYTPVVGDGAGSDQQPTLNGTAGWVNVSNLTVTIQTSQTWENQDVYLKINGVQQNTKIFTVSRKTLTSDMISLGAANDSGVVQLSFTDNSLTDVDKNIIASIINGGTVKVNDAASSIIATWDSTAKTFTLSSIPAADWENDQNVKIVVNTSDGNFEKGPVKTVLHKTLGADGFSLGAMDATNRTVKLTFTDNTTPGTIVTGADVLINGEVSSTITATWSSADTIFTLSAIPAASWDNAQSIKLTVKTRDGNFTPDTVVHTIAQRTLQASDITISEPSVSTLDNTASVTFKLIPATGADGLTISGASVDSSIGSVTGPNDSGVYTLSAVEGGTLPSNVTLSVSTSKGTISKDLYVNNAVQQNRFSTTFTPGSFDTSAIAGSRDLAATQISSIGRGIIMNKDLDAAYATTDTSTGATSTAKAVKAAKKTAKKAAKQAKTAKKATQTVEQAAAVVSASLEVTELPAETLAAPAPEDAVAMLLPQTANTNQVEPQTSVPATLVDTAATTTADEAPQDNLVLKLIIALAALVICVASGLTWFLKKSFKR